MEQEYVVEKAATPLEGGPSISFKSIVPPVTFH